MKRCSFTRTLSLLFILLSFGPITAQGSAFSYVGSVAVQALKQKHEVPSLDKPALAGDVWRRTELYFGSNRPDKPPVSMAQFMCFLETDVTPLFPDGLTLLTGIGQFRNAQGVTEREQAFVLILLFPLDAEDANEKIQAIRESYKRQFKQQSVLRVDSLSRISF